MEVLSVVLILSAFLLGGAALFLGASPGFWFGTWIGSEGDPEGMKGGCGSLLKWGVAVPGVLLLLGLWTFSCTEEGRSADRLSHRPAERQVVASREQP